MNLLYGKEYVEIDFDDSKVIVTFTTNNGQSKKFEDEQLQALSEENPAQTLQELALQIEINKLTISRFQLSFICHEKNSEKRKVASI